MARELAFVLINPYSLRKSRTGGILGRYFRCHDLRLAAVRMFAPSEELVRSYHEMIQCDESIEQPQRQLLADYIAASYSPDPATGRPQRVMMLVFEGDGAINEVFRITGKLRRNIDSGRTVRDVYGDYIVDSGGRVVYLEPAVLTGGPRPESVEQAIRLWARFSESDGGMVDRAVDIASNEQRTLVLIKPENFYCASSRPGNIVDSFSAAGMRIVGAGVHQMSVEQALQFYSPVRSVLRNKFHDQIGETAMGTLSQALGFTLPPDLKNSLSDLLAPVYGERKFQELINFMTGVWPQSVPMEQHGAPGREKTLSLVYQGQDAVESIRRLLGPTDPSKARPGSVRREYGRDVMVNAAHASDSPENAEREMGIIGVSRDNLQELVRRYYD